MHPNIPEIIEIDEAIFEAEISMLFAHCALCGNNGETDPPKTAQSDPPVTVYTDPPVTVQSDPPKEVRI